MHNSLYAVSIVRDLREESVEKISTRSTLQFKDEAERLLLCFCLHLLNTHIQQRQDGEYALSLKSLLIGLVSA